MLRFLLFFCLFLVFYAYLGYGMSLLFVSIFRRRMIQKEAYYPRVTFIVTVYNEQAQIKDKLINTLTLRYPRDALQILVVSDGIHRRYK